jgi:DNA-binding winged helix-turn-helix (wHTH) protein
MKSVEEIVYVAAGRARARTVCSQALKPKYVSLKPVRYSIKRLQDGAIPPVKLHCKQPKTIVVVRGMHMKPTQQLARLLTHDIGAAQLVEQDLIELIARIEALRRRPDTGGTKLRVGPLELDLIERTAQRGDRIIDLRPREYRLLEYMMRRKDQILTRELILKEVWKYKFVPQSNLIDVHMGRLRQKIDKQHESPMISNIRGVGFILRTPALLGTPKLIFSNTEM